MAKRWLLRRPKNDSRTRIFCFPYSGVGASMYARWPQMIGPAEVCLLQPPGRENRLREPHYGTYQDLAEDLGEFLEPYLDRPFGFFGHCGGALPGFATALRLAQLGMRTPATVFISSQVAPHEGPYGRFLSMSDEELAVELATLTKAMGGEPHPDLIELGLSVLRADVEANKLYRLPEPVRLPSALTVLGWTGDKEVQPELMGGWTEYSDQVRYAILPGEHYSFLSAPEVLMAELARDMAVAVADHRATA